MILAIRPVFFEPYLGGLDKMYRLHKWLGITGLVFAVTHWLWTQAPKWLSGLGLIRTTCPSWHGTRTNRCRLPVLSEPARTGRSPRRMGLLCGRRTDRPGAGEVVSLPAFLQDASPAGGCHLVLVFHSLVLMKFDYWGEFLAPLMAVLMLAGSASGIGILFRKTGRNRQSVGVISALTVPRPSKCSKSPSS